MPFTWSKRRSTTTPFYLTHRQSNGGLRNPKSCRLAWEAHISSINSDLQGNSLFEQQTRQINARLGEAYAGLKRPALGRFGETDDRSDELV